MANPKKRQDAFSGVDIASTHVSYNGSGDGTGPKELLSDEEAEANARLIAAAVNSYGKLPNPLAAAEGDLLGEALKALTEIVEGAVPAKRDWHMTSYAKLLAEKVIARARLARAKEGTK